LKFVERQLGNWGSYVVRHRGRVLLGTILITLASAPFAWQAMTHLDVNLFNQTSESLKRFRLVRELSEDFGGDILAAVVTIPDNPTPEQVKELKRFGDILTAELSAVGSSVEDRQELTDKLRADVDRVSVVKEETDDAAATQNEEGGLDARPTVKAHGGAWLRQVECRTGQGIEKALKKIAKQQPHVILTPHDVDELKGLFTPAALDKRMNEIAGELTDLTPNSTEALLLYEDPLGLRDLANRAMQQRLAQRKQALSGKDTDGYFLSPDKTTLVILGRSVLAATRLDFNRTLMAAAQRAENRAIAAFRKSSPAMKTTLRSDVYGAFAETEPVKNAPGVLAVGFTGMPAVTVENEMNLKYDMELNTIVSLAGILVLFLAGFRSIWLTWDVTVVTTLIIVYTVAIAGIWKGSISLLGSAFTAVPVGLSTDYAVFIYNTYHGLRLEGLNSEDAMRKTLERSGHSIITGATIASLAFFGVGLSHLSGMAEFGILGGISAIIGCVAMLLILPALMVRKSMNVAKKLPEPLSCGVPAFGRWMNRPGPRAFCVISGILVLFGTVGLIFFGPDPGPETVAGVKFDPELGNMRLLSSKAIPLRNRLSQRFNVGLADIRVVVSAENEAKAFEAAEQVQQRLQPYLDKGELTFGGNVLDYIPSGERQMATIAALKSFDIEAASEAFKTSAEKRFGPRGPVYFKPFLRRLQDFKLLTREPNILTLATVMQGPLSNVLAPYVRVETTDSGKGKVRLVSSWFPSSADYPARWYNDMAAKLETDPAAKGPFEVKMTAARMVGFELKEFALADTGLITLLVAIGIAISLVLAFGNVFNCVLATIPLIFANAAMLAGVVFSQIMGWDFSLNFVNLIMFPLLLGSSIGYGVYLVHDARTAGRPTLPKLMEGTGVSIFYCMGTTLVGFGSFMTSSYTGLLSMGIASCYGYLGALFGCLVVLPAVLGYLRDYDVARGRIPAEAAVVASTPETASLQSVQEPG
jgi:predicted RND superfamily exporter protein